MKRFQGFIVGVAVCLLLSAILTPALAKTGSEQLTALYNNIKIVLNGNPVEITMKDDKGNSIEPFTANGRTYLPVAALAEAMGLAVRWDGATSTVYLGADKDTAQPTVWLKDMPTLINDWTIGGETKDNLSNSYNSHLIQWSRGTDQGVTYALNMEYSKFTGRLILLEHAKSTGRLLRLVVYLDNEVAYISSEITAGVFPVDFSIDTTGAIRMRVQIQYSDDSGTSWGGAYDSSFGGRGGEMALVNAGLWE